ncbi:MAG: nitronate monooxygenase [Chloroflexi bacterium]|nr:nitronate monooxygenase [Chloroflexota bacterium]
MTERRLWTPLCDLLGIKYPVLQAGMVPGGSPELTAAVSNAGGLGVLGASGWEPEAIREKIRWIRENTNNPFGVDLQLPATMAEVDDNKEEIKATLPLDYPQHAAWVAEAKKRHNIPDAKAPPSSAYNPAFIRRQVEVILEEEVPVFVSALGPPDWMTADAHALGIKVIGMAGNIRHSKLHVKAGVDVVVAQGHEAGGHTGRIATMVLVPQVVDAIAPIPVVAAGGIGDGRGLAAALSLGAQGVWCGTLFLASEESGITPIHKQRIVEGRSEDWVISRLSSGKTARYFNNVLVKEWEESGLKALPMPLQGMLLEDLEEGAAEANLEELELSSGGQVGGLIKAKRPAAQILEEMVDQASEILSRLARETVASG